MEQKLFDAAQQLPETTLDFCDIQQAPRSSPSPKPRRALWAIAACLVLAFGIGIGSFAIGAEAREYNEAVNFFKTYNLSTEGLTREEIKTVYRDITEETFSNPKTMEVIVNTLEDQVGGYELPQENPTPEEMKSLWNTLNSGPIVWTPAPQQGICYKYRNEYNEDNALDFEKAYLEKYDGDTLLWSVSPGADSIISSYQTTSDGVFIWGRKESLYRDQAWLAKIDNNGQLLWKKLLLHDFEDEYITNILENEDGSYAVISRGDWRNLCLSQYSADGEELSFCKTYVGNYGFGAAAKMTDGYALQLFSFIENEFSKIVKLDTEGNITDTFVYDSEEVYYYITDMLEWNGRLYLSTYAVPKLDDPNQSAGGRYEIANILNEIFDNMHFSISSEELTPMVRANYKAMLLVCDPVSGNPQEFYSVDGSLGGKLSLGEDGRLLWDAESITSTFFSIATSSFTIGGYCTVYRYAFDGTTVSQWKTGEFTAYRK